MGHFARFSGFPCMHDRGVTGPANALAIIMHKGHLMYKAGPHTAVSKSLLTLSLIALSTLASISAFADSVILAWDPSVSTNVVGYRVYYGVGSRSYTNHVTVAGTSATVSGLVGATTYYFTATAYDSNGLESDYSSETNYTTAVPVNFPPTLNTLGNLTINQNAGQQTVNLGGISSGSASEIQTLTVTAVSDNTALIPTPLVTYTSPNATGTLKFTPVANNSGTANITVTVNDGQAQNNTVSQSFIVTVNSLNKPPTLNAIANVAVNQNSGTHSVALSGISSGSSTEHQTLIVSAVSDNPSVVPSPIVSYTSPAATGTLFFAPATDAMGQANITVTVNDGQSANNLFSRNFTINVGVIRPPPTNTPPVISTIANQSTTQDVAIAAIPFTISDAETPASSLTLSASSSNPTLIPNANIVFGGSDGNRTVTLTPAAGKSGTANITVTVSDGTDTTSTTFALNVISITSRQLVLSQEGQGTISPAMGSSITAGRTYTLTAKPGVGQEFAGWTGSINSDSPIIKFVANSNIVLHAKFVPSPYILGTYNGLFSQDSGVNQNSSGSFSVTVSAHGNYSGKIQLGASKLSFKGKFNLQCTTTNSIARKLAAPLTVQLRLGTNSETDQILGQLIDSGWNATMAGDRAKFSSMTNPCPFTGSYTMIIPGQSGDSTKPAGHGYGTVKVSTSGQTIFAGVLADGTKITQSTALSKNGVWPLYASLYVGQGSVLSWVTFANHASDDLSGTLSWIKLPVMTSRYYPSGFTTEVMSSGSKFVKPALTTDLIINVPNAVVDFSGGNLSSDFSNDISLGLSSKVTNLSANKLSMAFTTSSGLYKGTVVDPTSGATLPFAGAVFQKTQLGYGSLMGANQSSSVVVGP
jgi:hypothetical protein